MAKNKTFTRRYVIEFKGITTNNFLVKLLDRYFETITGDLTKWHKQLELTKFEKSEVENGKQ